MAGGLQSRDAQFAQLADALTHQIVIGRRSAEAVMILRFAALDVRFQAGEAVEQRGLILVVRAFEHRRHLGQLALAQAQEGREFARHRQRQQRHHAVGVDFHHALHAASCLSRREVP
jgi:hypothetical protein